MDKDIANVIVALLFIVVAGLRIIIAFGEPSLAFEGYLPLRIVEHIADSGSPIFQDPLSFSGRERVYSPVFYYLLAPFTYFFASHLVLKFIPNIIYAITVLGVYFCSLELTKNRSSCVIATVVAAFTPIIFSQHVNDASSVSVALPLFLVTIYALLNLQHRIFLFITSVIVLALTSPLVFVLLLGIVMFLLVMGLEGLKVPKAYSEALFFLALFGLWSVLVMYKKIFLSGLSLDFSYSASFISTVSIVGFLPFLFGVYAAYYALFEKREKKTLFMSSIAASVTLLLLLELIPYELGLLLLTLSLAILSARGFTGLLSYLDKTRIPHVRYGIAGFFVVFFMLTAFFPAISLAVDNAEDTPSREQIDAVIWLARSDPDGRVLAHPKVGYLLQYFGLEAVADEDPVLVVGAENIYSDIETVYRSRFVLPVLEVTTRSDSSHIFLSDTERELYARDQLLFLPNNCFREVYVSSITIYEVLCHVDAE